MLTKKQVRNYNARLQRYNSKTTEKEIETEFYKFISQYYYNKYTINGEGRLDYTAPYNIDGLLEIRTLDHDYRILVEAKTRKNFNRKSLRDEVLAQAIQYCRKLNHYGELLPSVILLIEKENIVIIETKELEMLINVSYTPGAASSVYMTDLELIGDLKAFNYNYEIFSLGDGCNYKKMFDFIDEKCLISPYRKSKVITNNFTMSIVLNFIELFDVFKSNGNYFLSKDKKYRKIALSDLKAYFVRFLIKKDYPANLLDFRELLSIMDTFIIDSKINYFKIDDQIINLDTMTIVNDSNRYTNSIENVTFNSTCSGDYFHQELGKILFKKTEQKYIIQTSIDNFPVLKTLFEHFNINYSLREFFIDAQVIVIDNLDNVNTHQCFNYNVLLFEGKITQNILLSKIIMSLSKFYAIDDKTLNAEQKWRENNDLLYGFLSETIVLKQNSYVLLFDLFDSFNLWLQERGNSKVSLRYFVEALQNHEYFTSNNLVYRKSTYVRKDLIHSRWSDPSIIEKEPRGISNKVSYIIGICFK